MATKLPAGKAARTTQRQASAAEVDAQDLATLHPDVELDIAGRHLVVREYRFTAGNQARALGRPIIDGLVRLVDTGDAIGADVEDYLDLLAHHQDLVRELMAASIEGADVDFLDSLDYDDGELLLLTWWNVCGRFFLRRAVRKLEARLRQRALRAASAGSTSSPPSPTPSTAASSTSGADTPSVN